MWYACMEEIRCENRWKFEEMSAKESRAVKTTFNLLKPKILTPYLRENSTVYQLQRPSGNFCLSK